MLYRRASLLAALIVTLSLAPAYGLGTHHWLSSAQAQTATAPAAPPPVVSAPVADPKAGTFVTVKDGAATVSGGSIIGELLMWLALVLGTPLAGLLVSHVILPFAKKLGVEVSAQQSAKLETTIANGLALSAQRAQVSLKDKLDIDVKNDVAVKALQYVQDHGAETLKGMGVKDPNDPKVIEALQARIAKAMDDKVGSVSVAATVAPAAPAASL